MWGQLATWPDLSFSISLLAWFQANPGINHWNTIMHIVGYIKNTIDYGLTYSHNSDLSPTIFVDANYGGCRDIHCSSLEYVFMIAGGAVTWSSKHQTTVALSTVEAEYVAMSQCMQQMVWVHSWLDKVDIEYSIPGIIKGDNSGAIALMKTTKDHGKVKHINIHHHYICELIYSGTIIIEHVTSTNNLADLFTKPLFCDNHHHILASLDIKWALLCPWGSVKLCPELAPNTQYLTTDYLSIIPILSFPSSFHCILVTINTLPPFLWYYIFFTSCITYSQSFYCTQLRVSLLYLYPTLLLIYFYSYTCLQ